MEYCNQSGTERLFWIGGVVAPIPVALVALIVNVLFIAVLVCIEFFFQNLYTYVQHNIVVRSKDLQNFWEKLQYLH